LRESNGVFLSVFELTQEHLQVAKALLKGGADVNACDKNRRTPLHLVSEQGYLQGVQLLLDSGADVKARDKENMTPLHLALQTGYLKVVRLLLDCGTGPDTRGKDDQPALHLALKNACRYVPYPLLDVHAEINAGKAMADLPSQKAMACLHFFRSWNKNI
jgi:ankyrin repeat protein